MFAPVYARVQLEKGEAGTPHLQGCFGTKNALQLKAVISRLKGHHVEIAKNALAAWRYCGKEDSRIGVCLEMGIPPAAKNIKGDTKARNDLILEKGVEHCVREGLIPIEKYQ